MRHAKLIVFAAALLACSTPESRINGSQAAFDSYPPEVQRKIRQGKAEVGFTPEQVKMALGAPSRTYTRKSADLTQEVWAYGGGGSSIGFGFGMGGGPVSYGVGVGTGSDAPEDRARVVFEGGRVVSVESRDK